MDQGGPNKWGHDVFALVVVNNKLVPFGSEGMVNTFDTSCRKNKEGWGCAAWVVYKGNMEYLHCDDLNWNGKQKCSK